MKPEHWQLGMGIGLTAIQVLLLIPLSRSVWRSRDMSGVSPAGEAMWVLMGVGWLIYGQQSGSPVLMVSGTVAAAGSAIMLSGGWPKLSTRDRRSALSNGLVTLLLLGVPSIIWALPGLTWALAVLGGIQFVPQCWSVWGSWRHGHSLSGVDPTTALWRTAYVFGWAAYAAGWFIFGYSRMDIPLVTWGLAGTVAWGATGLLALRRGVMSSHSQPAPTQKGRPSHASHTPHRRRGPLRNDLGADLPDTHTDPGV